MAVLIAIISVLTIHIINVKANPSLSSNENNMVNLINRNQLEEEFLRKLNMKCSQRDNHSCMMSKLIAYMNKIFEKSTFDINENLKVTKIRMSDSPSDDLEDAAILAKSIKNDEETVGYLVAEKLWKFLRSREMRYRLTNYADFIMNSEPRGGLNLGFSIQPFNSDEKGRGKMKNMGPLMAIIAAKMGLISAIFIKGLILLTGKALIVSKLALILAVIIGLKKLLSKKMVTYEVVGHPHHETPHQHHDTYSSGWARSLDGFLNGLTEVPEKILDSQELAFSAQKPELFSQ